MMSTLIVLNKQPMPINIMIQKAQLKLQARAQKMLKQNILRQNMLRPIAFMRKKARLLLGLIVKPANFLIKRNVKRVEKPKVVPIMA